MGDIKSILVLQKLVFDKVLFERNGFRTDNKLKLEMQVQIEKNEVQSYRVTLIANGIKSDEYSFSVSLSGYFNIESTGNLDDQIEKELITKNAVAILMPYLRSEVTLLTSQPETDPVVLPIFNINKMMEKA